MKTEKSSSQNLNIKRFYSIKNKCKFTYTSDAELSIMLLSEFDQSVITYSNFQHAIINYKNHNAIEMAPALILNSDSSQTYIIFSEILCKNPKLAQDTVNFFQSRALLNRPINLLPTDPSTEVRNNLIDNIEFLYSSALLPPFHRDFSIIKEILDFYEEISIGKLKTKVRNFDSIYQLIFHHALRADISSAVLNDQTIVTASPIFNSIIKNL